MTKRVLCAVAVSIALCQPVVARDWPGFSCGMGIGGWLTNYKRFNVLPEKWRLTITEGDLEHFDSYITERDIASIKSWGFDHVRLGFDQIVLEEAPGRYRERTFRKIDDFVGWCEKHGLNIVLNLHKAVGNYCDIEEKVSLLDDAGLQDRFIALWLALERRYRDKPGLAFELLNEVRNVDAEKWNALADRTLKAIRAVNPTRWVVVGSTDWNSPNTLAQLKLWDDDRVVYTFHMYTPYEFTHQRGVLQAGPLYFNRVMAYPSKDVERYRAFQRDVNGSKTGGYEGVSEIGRDFVRASLSGARAFARRHPDKILWNGEFGTIRHAPSASRVAYMRDVVEACQDWGIPYCVWNYLSTPNDGNRFSLVDDETRAFLSPELLQACLGKRPEGGGVQSGAGACSLNRKAEGADWSFGDASLSLRFDGRSGFPVECAVEGEVVLVRDARLPSPVVVSPADGEPWKETVASAFALAAVKQEDGRTLHVTSTNADWRITVSYRLQGESLMLRRAVELEWQHARPGKLKKLWLSGGLVPCRRPRGGYRRPLYFPPKFVSASTFADGVTERGHEDISPIIGENGSGWSVAFVQDTHQPYSDRAWSFVTQREAGFSLSALYEAQGHVKKGVPQRVGDTWHVFRRGDADRALEALPSWFAAAGMKVVADREERVKGLLLYSTHPKGTTAEWLSDTRGFRAMTNSLPLVKALGMNAIWLRPVEDHTCYVPRDYYKLMDGVGTPDDFRAFVAAAHGERIEVWRDAVMHGGFSNNERTKAHPEWLAYREDGTSRDFWGYDFNWPSWIDYFAAYVRHMTRAYSLDGWRLDVPIGSLNPNWSLDIPYARASYAQCQGAWSQQRAIRAAMRAENPRALSLAESNLSQHGTASDSIYDQRIAHDNLPEALKSGMSPKDFVTAMRRWLYEQELSFLPDIVLMRYPESHDTERAADRYGRAPTDALMALCAWIKGFPLVYNEGEDGCFETWRRIFAVRRAVPEISRGQADYRCVTAPDGVFACLRSGGEGTSVVLVNFNPVRVKGMVEWPGGSFPVNLNPYGYLLRRVKGPDLATLIPPSDRKPFAVRGSAEAFGTPVFDLRDASNRRVGADECVRVSRDDRGWHARVVDLKGRSPKDVRLVVRFPGAERWFAHSSDGAWNSPHFVWHPGYDVVPSTSYHTTRHGALRWRNLYHPFGLDGTNADVGAIAGDRALAVRGFSPAATVLVWDRVEAEPTLAVSVGGADLQDLRCDVVEGESRTMSGNRGPDTGDSRLKVMMGGYEFEEGGFRIRIDRVGMVRAIWTRTDGAWRRQPLDRYLDAKLVQTPAREKAAVDCCHRLSRLPDGRVSIDFFDGFYKDEARVGHAYRVAYRLGGEQRVEASYEEPIGK